MNLTDGLRTIPNWALNTYAALAAFACYFCMYAFRKPFTAAEFTGTTWLNSTITLKTAFLTSQILGYTISKYAGIKVCSEAAASRRAMGLVVLIGIAEMALVLFAILPSDWKIVAMFVNGLPLGMVWGFAVRYLEGRRSSDLLYAAMACSIIVASATVKDAGRALLLAGISESWMPAMTGMLFLAPFLISVWMLEHLPQPQAEEVALRAPRVPMPSSARRAFLGELLLPLSLFFAANMLLTAFRDFRDNFGIEILNHLGYAETAALFSRTDMPIALTMLAVLGGFSLIRCERLNFSLLIGTMASGTALVGISTWLFTAQAISGLTWIGLIGLGAFLAYIPLNAMIFDRIVSLHGKAATAVFAISIADATGYTVTLGLLFYKDLFAPKMLRVEFLQQLAYAVSILGSLAIVLGGILMIRMKAAQKHSISVQ